MADKKETVKTPASKKPVAKRTAVKKTSAKRVSAKSGKATKTALSEISEASAQIKGLVKDGVYAGFGFYGLLFDEMQTQVKKLQKSTPKQWDSLVERGEQVVEDINEVVESADIKVPSVDLPKVELPKVDFAKISFPKVNLKEKREQFDDVVDSVKTFLTSAAA